MIPWFIIRFVFQRVNIHDWCAVRTTLSAVACSSRRVQCCCRAIVTGRIFEKIQLFWFNTIYSLQLFFTAVATLRNLTQASQAEEIKRCTKDLNPVIITTKHSGLNSDCGNVSFNNGVISLVMRKLSVAREGSQVRSVYSIYPPIEEMNLSLKHKWNSFKISTL